MLDWETNLIHGNHRTYERDLGRQTGSSNNLHTDCGDNNRSLHRLSDLESAHHPIAHRITRTGPSEFSEFKDLLTDLTRRTSGNVQASSILGLDKSLKYLRCNEN